MSKLLFLLQGLLNLFCRKGLVECLKIVIFITAEFCLNINLEIYNVIRKGWDWMA